MGRGADLPIWVVVLGCGLAVQFLKFLLYSLANRKPDFVALGQNHGLPSTTASVFSCLLVLTWLRTGWGSSATGFALVFAVIVIHDTVKLRALASLQREAVYHLVRSWPEAGRLQQRVVDYLDPRTHHPAHVAVGVLLGGLFALAFGVSPR